MPKGIKGWIFLAAFIAAVWYVWTRVVRSRVS